MAKRAEVQKVEEVPALGTGLDFSSVIQSESLTMAEKRKTVLEKLGLKATKKKYATPEERKAASKLRAKERREARIVALKPYGLEPAKRGPKKTKAQKKLARKARGKARREFIRDMAKADPDLAKKYGIDPKRFKL